jgi:uncharacterized membrane protein
LSTNTRRPTFAKTISISDHFLIVITVLAIAFGVFCRVEGVTRRSLWLDEVMTVCRISYPTVAEVVDHLKDTPFPPLYYCMLWLWTRPWGVNVASLRGFSVVLGVLVLPATYLIWKDLVGRRAALWGVLLLSASAFPI